eukprot:COSAG01_NODE_2691_length_7244_cov_143.957465_2_plen_261_part_00
MLPACQLPPPPRARISCRPRLTQAGMPPRAKRKRPGSVASLLPDGGASHTSPHAASSQDEGLSDRVRGGSENSSSTPKIGHFYMIEATPHPALVRVVAVREGSFILEYLTTTYIGTDERLRTTITLSQWNDLPQIEHLGTDEPPVPVEWTYNCFVSHLGLSDRVRGGSENSSSTPKIGHFYMIEATPHPALVRVVAVREGSFILEYLTTTYIGTDERLRTTITLSQWNDLPQIEHLGTDEPPVPVEWTYNCFVSHFADEQ